MSLPMLNEHQPISLGYRRLLAHTWGPARVATATVQQHGPEAIEPHYEAMARRIFAGADHYQVIREDLASVIVDAVSEVGLPVGLADAAANSAYDGSLRIMAGSLELGSTEPDRSRPASTGRGVVPVNIASARSS